MVRFARKERKIERKGGGEGRKDTRVIFGKDGT